MPRLPAPLPRLTLPVLSGRLTRSARSTELDDRAAVACEAEEGIVDVPGRLAAVRERRPGSVRPFGLARSVCSVGPVGPVGPLGWLLPLCRFGPVG